MIDESIKIEENVKKVLSEIAAGNDRGEKITLVAATKTVPAELINVAVKAGVEVVAENRVQEFREKTGLIVGARQDFIGHLQTNKVKYLVGRVDIIHSIDSLRLAEAVSAEAEKRNGTQKILIEINIGGELSKSGFTPDNAEEAFFAISALPRLNVCGLMAMLPKTDDENLKEKLCLQMRGIYDKINLGGGGLSVLSMGMSADYKTAIRCGSNEIRLGSALFGKRV